MLTIFVDKITVRLNYTFSLIFDDRGIMYRLTDDTANFKKARNPKLIYAANKIEEDCIHILPSPVLFDLDIRKYKIVKEEWNGEEVLSFDGITDVFASIFYIVSLYDDYLQKEKDAHQRNKGKNSLLYRFDWLDKLMVERWSELIIRTIEEKTGHSFKSKKILFSCVPTFDVDHAYAYRLRKPWRKYSSILKDVLTGNWKRIKERKAVLSGRQKDPYDTFDKIYAISKDYDTRVFWLLGFYGKYDRNISNRNFKHHQMVRDMDNHAPVGLHPSYNSNLAIDGLSEEKAVIEAILQRSVTHSRQHFLKVELPETYRKLQQNGFLDDYSLGYADCYGFRAGIARPFDWFDLPANTVSVIKIHPFAYMDGTLREYMGLSIHEAKEIVIQLKEEVKKYGGDFIGVWHNETISDYGNWKGWYEVFKAGM